MSEIMQAIQEADTKAIALERAREAVESAKAALEAAKEAFDEARGNFEQSLSKAEELGLPKAKVRKLIEERTAALVASGLVPGAVEAPVKTARPAKTAKKKVVEENSDALESAMDEVPAELHSAGFESTEVTAEALN